MAKIETAHLWLVADSQGLQAQELLVWGSYRVKVEVCIRGAVSVYAGTVKGTGIQPLPGSNIPFYDLKKVSGVEVEAAVAGNWPMAIIDVEISPQIVRRDLKCYYWGQEQGARWFGCISETDTP